MKKKVINVSVVKRRRLNMLNVMFCLTKFNSSLSFHQFPKDGSNLKEMDGKCQE